MAEGRSPIGDAATANSELLQMSLQAGDDGGLIAEEVAKPHPKTRDTTKTTSSRW